MLIQLFPFSQCVCTLCMCWTRELTYSETMDVSLTFGFAEFLCVPFSVTYPALDVDF